MGKLVNLNSGKGRRARDLKKEVFSLTPNDDLIGVLSGLVVRAATTLA